ncbi:MAG: putative Ig domain-containing protein, partial [Candidatus Gracilibacteria bacterium]|nr:putative Ig domain-containing protein [Candidatus Gracilibacteria bacterium]
MTAILEYRKNISNKPLQIRDSFENFISTGEIVAKKLNPEKFKELTSVRPSPTTALAPIFVSKTDTTIYTTPGIFTNVDGVRNVTVKLYSNAALTTFVEANVNGDFTGLIANTRYWLVTTGESYNKATKTWETKVSPALAVTTGVSTEVPPIMGDIPNQNAINGTAYNLNVSTFTTLTNGDPISTYTLTGALPTGVTFNSTTGLLSGTPTQTGTFNLSVTATDNDGISNSDAFTLTVAAAPEVQVPPIMGDIPNQNAINGTAYNLNVSTFTTLTNGDPISTYTLT